MGELRRFKQTGTRPTSGASNLGWEPVQHCRLTSIIYYRRRAQACALWAAYLSQAPEAQTARAEELASPESGARVGGGRANPARPIRWTAASRHPMSKVGSSRLFFCLVIRNERWLPLGGREFILLPCCEMPGEIYKQAKAPAMRRPLSTVLIDILHYEGATSQSVREYTTEQP